LVIAAVTIGIGVSALSPFVLPATWGSGKEHWVALAVLGGMGASAMAVPTALLFFEARLMESTKAQIATAIVTTVGVVALTPRFGVPGQLAATAAAPFLLLPFVARVARKSRLWPSSWRPAPDADYLSRALKLGATSLVSGLSMQGALYFIRSELEAVGGAELNGQFQASWAIGSVYLGVLLGGLGSYVFPRYARAESEVALQKEVDEAGRFMSNLAPPLVLMAVAFAGVAVNLLYSARFAPAVEILAWQLSGDVAKCLSWVYAGPLLFRGRVRAYITTEVLGATLFATAAFFFLRASGVNGVGQAYFVTYALYLPLTAIVLRLSCRVRARTRDLTIVGAVTTILGILASFFTDQPLVRAGLVFGAAVWIWRSGQARMIWDAAKSKLLG
jgi:PST family polysaccharide transporter